MALRHWPLKDTNSLDTALLVSWWEEERTGCQVGAGFSGARSKKSEFEARLTGCHKGLLVTKKEQNSLDSLGYKS